MKVTLEFDGEHFPDAMIAINGVWWKCAVETLADYLKRDGASRTEQKVREHLFQILVDLQLSLDDELPRL